MSTLDNTAAVAETPWIIDRDLHFDLEQFYFREARLLDNRELQQWMGLLTEDVTYIMPVRSNPMRDPKKRGTESYLNVDSELSEGLDPPHRDENFFTIALRVNRTFKANSWSDNPPARTRRFISNVEIEAGGSPDELKVYSNFLCTFSRHQIDNVTYSGQRQDVIRVTEEGFKIASRRVIIDWNVVTAPSLGLYF